MPEFKGATLSDGDIRRYIDNGEIGFKSPELPRIQPASMDITLARRILVCTQAQPERELDLRQPVDWAFEEIVMDDTGYSVSPGGFILGVTREWFRLPRDLKGEVDGKSSLGRVALFVHITAGYIDPGFEGHVTLEIKNGIERPIRIYPYMPIGQFQFGLMSSPVETPYGAESLGSKNYKNEFSPDPSPKPSEYYKNFK